MDLNFLDFLNDQDLLVQRQTVFTAGLWFGLASPYHARAALDKRFDELLAMLSDIAPEARASELEIAENILTREAMLHAGLEQVSLYEETQQHLPAAPAALERIVNEKRAG